MALSEVDVRGGPEAPAEARRALAEALAGRVSPSVLDDLGLLVSELVTNSVVHGGVGEGEIVGLAFGVSEERVRVEVTDAGPGFAGEPPPADGEEAGGYGLFLVTQVADAWGVSDDAEPTKVWFELRHR